MTPRELRTMAYWSAEFDATPPADDWHPFHPDGNVMTATRQPNMFGDVKLRFLVAGEPLLRAWGRDSSYVQVTAN